MKNLFVFVLLIIASISIAKADNWTNAGEYSYLYPNGTKLITDYTLTEDGKSIVVIILDSSNKANNYYRYKLQRIDLETGVIDFDTLYITNNQHKFILSRDGLTMFDIHDKSQYYNCSISYSLVDIYHSSRGYLFQKSLVNNQGDYKNSSSISINFINFLYKSNILICGLGSVERSHSSFPSYFDASTTNGSFKIFNILDSLDFFYNDRGSADIYDYSSGLKHFVFYQHHSTSGTDRKSSSNSTIVLVDSNKKTTKIFNSYNDSIPTQSLKLVGDSILIIRRDAYKNNVIHYYNINNQAFSFRYKFPFFDNNKNTKISFSTDGQYFIKTAPNKKLQLYKSYFYYPVTEIPLPSELNNFKDFKYSTDDKYIITVNNENQFIRLSNPLKSDKLNAYFTINDTALFTNRIYKPKNLSSGQADSYSWDFGNGTTSKEFEPEFKYDVPGNYTITLTAEKNGENSTQTKKVTVLPDYKVDFEIVKIPEFAPIVCEFKNTSSDNIDSLVWDFGDGTFSKSKETNISHTYKIEQEFNVKLKVFYKQFCDSIEKKVLIKDIKGVPLDLEKYSEYDFDNQTSNHRKINAIYETPDGGFILVNLEKLYDFNFTTVLYKTSDEFDFNKKIILGLPIKFIGNPDNYSNLHFNTSLKLNENKYIFNSNDSIRIFDSQLNKISSTKINNDCNIFQLALPKYWSDTSRKITTIFRNSSYLYLGDYNYIAPIKQCELYAGGFDLKRHFALYLAYTPVNNNISFYSRCYLYYVGFTNLLEEHYLYRTYNKQTVNLKDLHPFVAFSNTDINSFVGLDTLGYIYKFNAQGDSLKQIYLCDGLVNIEVNKGLYYAVGSKEGHPICYVFDNELNILDNIYIKQREGVFEDALICKNGDLIFAGYNYRANRFTTSGESLQNSYLLRIYNYTSTKDSIKKIPISITNPIDHLATIRIKADTSTTIHYEIYDLSGNLVFKTVNENIESDFTGTVDFSGLAPGVYIFKFYINGKIVTKKVIYQK